MNRIIPFLVTIMGLCASLRAQDTVQIAIVSEANDDDRTLLGFIESVKSEINALTQFEYTIKFDELYASYDLGELRNIINISFEADDIDIVVAVGSLASTFLAQRTTYEKPAIASIIVDQEMQRIPKTDSATSGVLNFTYVQSPFSIEKDLEILYSISPFTKLGIIGSRDFDTYLPFLDTLTEDITAQLGASTINLPVKDDMESFIEEIPADVDAIYVLPLFDDLDDQGIKAMFSAINERGLPSAALMGDTYANFGALIGHQSSSNLQKMPRRVAIDVSKILRGSAASDLTVEIPSYSDHVVVNMETARTIGVFPNWDLMNQSILLNFNEVGTDTVYNLENIIVEVLQHNLGFLAQQRDPAIAEKEVAIAKSALLPQVDASSSLAQIDPTRATGSFGTQGETNWAAGASLSQLIVAEPAIANIAIQKILQKSSEKELEQAYLDIILDAAQSYLNVLQAESFLKIALQNEELNRENFDISRAKENVGYSGASDLNRWRTELALASIDVNDANAQLQQARLFLNQLLNHPQDQFLKLEEVTLQDQVVLVTDPRILEQIQNPGDLRLFADFLVDEALRNSPEISQINYGIAAQERLKLSQKRSFYIPSIALNGQWDYTLRKWNVTETPGVPIPETKPSWSLGLGLQYSILQGQKRRHQLDQTKLSLVQLDNQLGDVRNQIELRVRSDLERAGASFSRVTLFREAANAAQANFEIVQDAYSQGSVNITALIDAQNAALQTELSAQNAVYQFIVDFLTLERSSGKFYFLAPESERTAFFERLDQYIAQQKIDR